MMRRRSRKPAVISVMCRSSIKIHAARQAPRPNWKPNRPPPRSAVQSELLKDCAGVKPGAAFEGNSFAAVVQTAVDRIKRKAFTAAGMTEAQQRNVILALIIDSH